MRLLIAALFSIACASLVHLSAQRAEAHEYEAGAITIEHPTITPTPAGRNATAGYMTLLNRGAASDRLVSASSPLAERIEIHETRADATGAMTMRALPDGVAIPARGRAVLSPGGLHLMITGLGKPLQQGEALPLTLRFERAGSVEILASVERPHAAHGRHSGHGQMQ